VILTEGISYKKARKQNIKSFKLRSRYTLETFLICVLNIHAYLPKRYKNVFLFSLNSTKGGFFVFVFENTYNLTNKQLKYFLRISLDESEDIIT